MAYIIASAYNIKPRVTRTDTGSLCIAFGDTSHAGLSKLEACELAADLIREADRADAFELFLATQGEGA